MEIGKWPEELRDYYGAPDGPVDRYILALWAVGSGSCRVPSYATYQAWDAEGGANGGACDVFRDDSLVDPHPWKKLRRTA